MTSLEKKTLLHISKELGEFSHYEAYSAVANVIEKSNINKTDAKNILDTFNQAFEVQHKKARSAKGWVDALLESESQKNL